MTKMDSQANPVPVAKKASKQPKKRAPKAAITRMANDAPIGSLKTNRIAHRVQE